MRISCISGIGKGGRTSSGGQSCRPRLRWGHRRWRRRSGIAAGRVVGGGNTRTTWVNTNHSLTDRFSRLSGKTGRRDGCCGAGRRHKHWWGRDCRVCWRVCHRLGRLSAKWWHRRKTWYIGHRTALIYAVQICRCGPTAHRTTAYRRHRDWRRLNWLWGRGLWCSERVVTWLSVPVTRV